METLLNPAQQLFRWPSTIMSPPQPPHSFHYGPLGDETGHQELSDRLFVLFDTTPVGGNVLLAPLSGWGGGVEGGEPSSSQIGTSNNRLLLSAGGGALAPQPVGRRFRQTESFVGRNPNPHLRLRSVEAFPQKRATGPSGSLFESRGKREHMKRDIDSV